MNRWTIGVAALTGTAALALLGIGCSSDTAEFEPKPIAPASTVAASTVSEPTTTTDASTPTTTMKLGPNLAAGSGTGNAVVEISIPMGPALATFTHDGSGSFFVTALDEDNIMVSVLVFAHGEYEGTRPLQFWDFEHVSALEIEADGDWTYAIAPMSEIEVLDCPIRGSGDDVIAVRDFRSSSGWATITFSGRGGFEVWAYGGADVEVLVDVVGSDEETVRVLSGQYIWAIEEVAAEGVYDWTIECG